MKAKDKRIIVTGAGAGIGRELTLQLLSKGAYVAALDINESNLQSLKEASNNSECLSIHVVDMANEDDLNKFKEDYYTKHKVIDGLINNAGIIQPFINVDKLDMDTINRVMNVNFFGPLKLTKLFLPELLKRDDAHIVNVSSMGGFFPFPGQSVYGASKAALKLFTEGLYSELLNTNVKVTIVFPGAVATNIAANSNVKMETSEGSSKYKMLSPVKAASLIIEGMEKNKFKLYIGTDSKMMNLMYKINDKAAIKYINKKMQHLTSKE
ncbi:MAG: SDR family NAD(P)-dependent oxidoreductase [Bacilli bacterium]|nr:SDR family NAD(P)-dependent oxidoreductase [Bacilli bacterium]